MSTTVRSARIAKGRYNTDQSREASVFIVSDQRINDLKSEIERLKNAVSEARETARKDVAEKTASQVDAAFKKGFKEGKSEGFSEGKTSVRSEVNQAVELVGKLIAEIENGMDIVWRDIHQKAADLSLVTARMVVGRIAEEYDELALKLAKKCIQMVRDQAKVRILVNLQDIEMLRVQNTDLMLQSEGIKEIEIVEQASIKRGGVIIETEGGQIDGRFEEQLSAFEAALKPGWSQPEKGMGDEGRITNQ
ncbi:hypothetical protein HQ587_02880 [bacterium]|nr:hypothetical protein [bacterium]